MKELKELWKYATQDLSVKEIVVGSIAILFTMLLLCINF